MTDSPSAPAPQEQPATVPNGRSKREVIGMGVAISLLILLVNISVVLVVSRDDNDASLSDTNTTRSSRGSAPTRSPRTIPTQFPQRPVSTTRRPTPIPTRIYTNDPTLKCEPSPIGCVRPIPTISDELTFSPNPTPDYSPYPTRFPTTSSPTRRATNVASVVWFINNITLANRTISAPSTSQYTDDIYSTDDNYFRYIAEEDALGWLIYRDPLELLPFALADQFRLTQRYALLTLGLKPFYINEDLLNDTVLSIITDECTWTGITCMEVDLGNETGVQNVVTKINATTSTYEFTTDIGLLSHLTWLHKEASYTTTTLPQTLSRLDKLEYLNVSAVSGILFPESVGNWTNLRTMSLTCWNEYYIDYGTIPASISAWTNLQVFELVDCRLLGTLPSLVGSWTNLTSFKIRNSGITGELPPSIGQWSRLEFMNIASNTFNGTLPDIMATWTNLQSVNLALNAFTGSLPEWTRQWTSVEHLELTNAGLNGTLPEAIGAWTNAVTIFLSENDFTGTLPTTVGQWTNLEEFHIVATLLNGTIPSAISNWTALRSAYFEMNDFTGTLPTDLCQATGLIILQADCLYDVMCTCCTYCNNF